MTGGVGFETSRHLGSFTGSNERLTRSLAAPILSWTLLQQKRRSNFTFTFRFVFKLKNSPKFKKLALCDISFAYE